MRAHAFNPSTHQAEADGAQSKLQDSQGYAEKPRLEKTKDGRRELYLVCKSLTTLCHYYGRFWSEHTCQEFVRISAGCFIPVLLVVV